MCGIAGFLKTSDYSPHPIEVEQLLINLRDRGTDATGVAWWNGEKINVLKSPVMADDFIETPTFKKLVGEIASSKWFLLHTRAATNGSPENKLNNHPIYNQHGLIIHNGVVHADSPLPAQGETDTEQVLLHLQRYGWKGINYISGFLSIAYVNHKFPERFYLYSHGAPLVYSKGPNGIFFCSTGIILRESIYTSELQVTDLPKDVICRVKGNNVVPIHQVFPKVRYIPFSNHYGVTANQGALWHYL